MSDQGVLRHGTRFDVLRPDATQSAVQQSHRGQRNEKTARRDHRPGQGGADRFKLDVLDKQPEQSEAEKKTGERNQVGYTADTEPVEQPAAAAVAQTGRVEIDAEIDPEVRARCPARPGPLR
jgi:hypothetical protein